MLRIQKQIDFGRFDTIEEINSVRSDARTFLDDFLYSERVSGVDIADSCYRVIDGSNHVLVSCHVDSFGIPNL